MKETTVTICGGTTCFLMGASHFQSLKEHLPEDIQPYVTIKASHCLGFCTKKDLSRAPFVLIDDIPAGGVTLPKLIQWVEKTVREEPFKDGEKPKL